MHKATFGFRGRIFRIERMVDKRILERYLSGRGSSDERDEVVSWFAEIGEEKSLKDASLPTWKSPDPEVIPPVDVSEQILDKINHSIRLLEKPDNRGTEKGVRFLRIISRIAAVLFIPLLVYTWAFRDQRIGSGGETMYSEIQCLPGTRTRFQLPDGSSGWLNGGSSLAFPIKFTGKTREVRLAGEGYFDVVTIPKKPFVVNTDNTVVKAFGTSFNVCSYQSEGLSEVTLVEGDVIVYDLNRRETTKLAKLYPGQMCSYNLRTSSFRVNRVEVDDVISWTEGKLIFRNEPMKEVIRKCNRWFNVNIVIVDKVLEEFEYVGTFQDETIDEVLKLFALSAPLEYKDMGRIQRADGSFEKRKIELRLKRRKQR